MSIFIFIVVGLATFLVLSKILRGEKLFNWAVGISIVIGIFFASIGTYRGCADSWKSTSIGRQGACSHHGGVQTFNNIYGWGGLVVGSLIIFAFIKIYSGDSNEPPKEE